MTIHVAEVSEGLATLRTGMFRDFIMDGGNMLLETEGSAQHFLTDVALFFVGLFMNIAHMFRQGFFQHHFAALPAIDVILFLFP